MRIPRQRRLAAGAAAGALLLVAACGGGSGGGGGGDTGSSGGGGNEASDIGVTADSVTIGAHFPLTGVAAPGYSEIPTGAQAYFDYVNAAGGVNGRQIEYIVRDDAYNPANTSQVTNQLVLQDEIFAMVGGLGTPTHSAVLEFLNGEGVPDLFVSSGSILWDNPEEFPTTFGWQTDYESEAKIIGQYVAENMPDARVGLFLQDDDLGDDSELGVRQFIDDQIVAAVRYVPGNTDVAPQIAELQQAGADLVLGFNVPSYTALSQLVALRLNYDPQFFYANIGSDPGLVGSLLNRFSEGAVSDASPLEGIMTTEYIPTIDTPDDPWIQLWQRVWDEHGGDGELTNFRVYGMTQAYLFVQALQAAGQNPTREGIVEAIETQGAEFEGPWFVPLRYSADRHAGIGGMKLVQLGAGGAAEDLTPLLQTDVGDAPIEEFTGEPSMPTDSGIPEVQPAG